MRTPKPTKSKARTKAARTNGKLGGRPPLPEEERRRQWNGKLAPVTIERLVELAEREGISQGAVVDKAVERMP